MAFKINGVTVLDDNREVTVNGITATANDRVFVGVTATNSPTSVLSPSIFQGSVSGYTSGGNSVPGAKVNIIDKFPFASDTNATDVGDLTVAGGGMTSFGSTTKGYNAGGNKDNSATAKLIDSFPFASDTNASGVGNLALGRREGSGGISSSTFGYISGGYSPFLTSIEKFSFAFEGQATDVGDITQARTAPSGQSSLTHGYTTGGRVTGGPPLPSSNTIDKFPFAVDTNATDVGDLIAALGITAGQSSTTHGYSSSGLSGSPLNDVNTIEKFPFASDTNATDVGDLSEAKRTPAGQSSTTNGYVSGGSIPPVVSNVIDKFPFSSDTNATDIGDLTQARENASGQQSRTIQ